MKTQERYAHTRNNEREFCSQKPFSPLVSVVLPTFRRGFLLPCILNALANQSYKNFEVITVLKPSNDNSRNIIRSFQKKLNLRLFLQREGYISRGFNIALKHAKGVILVFTEDDTIPPQDFLERHVREYERNSKLGGLTGECVYFTNEDFRASKTNCSLKKTFRHNKYKDVVSSQLRTLSKPVYGIINRVVKPFKDYDIGVTISGGIYGHPRMNKNKSINFWAGNMSFRRDAIEGIYVYEDSLNPYRFEAYLAVVSALRGFDVDEHIGSGPLNYHIYGEYDSQTRQRVWFKVFEVKFEDYLLFYRLKKLGLKMSGPAFSLRCASHFLYYVVKLKDDRSYLGALLALILVHFYGIFVMARHNWTGSSIFLEKFLKPIKLLKSLFQ